MAIQALGAADGYSAGVHAERALNRAGFGAVADRRCAGVGIDVVDLLGRDCCGVER